MDVQFISLYKKKNNNLSIQTKSSET